MKLNNELIFVSLEKLDLINTVGGGYGFQCFVGTAGSMIVGAAALGPVGAGLGFAGGSTAFCYSSVG